MKSTFWTAAVVSGGLLVAAGGVMLVRTSDIRAGQEPAGSQARDSQPLPHPVVDAHQLMSLFNRPLFVLLKGTMQKSEEDQQYWNTVNERGLQAAEVANLVAMRRDNPQWHQHAASLQQAGIRLAEAAKNQDSAQTKEAYQGLIARCNACHQAFAPGHAPQLQP
jgi:hypothetical protein